MRSSDAVAASVWADAAICSVDADVSSVEADTCCVAADVCSATAAPDPASSKAPWKIYNIGNSHPEELTYVISLLEKEFGRVADKQLEPMQPGDVEATYADTAALEQAIGFKPATPIEDGIAQFAKWYREYMRA